MDKIRNGLILIAVAFGMIVVSSLLPHTRGALSNLILAGLAFVLSLTSVGVFLLGLIRLIRK